MPEGSRKLRFSDLFRLSLRTFKIKPVRLILTILGMSIGTGVVVFLISLGYGLQYILLGNLVTTQDSLVTLEASYADTNIYIKPQDISAISQLSGVTEVSPENDFSGEIQTGTSSLALVDVQVVEPDYFRLTGTTIDTGQAYIAGDPAVVLTSQAAELLQIATSTKSLGTPINVQVEITDNLTGSSTVTQTAHPLPVVGIINDDSLPPQVYLPAEGLTSAPLFYTSILVKAKDLASVEVVRNELTDRGLTVSARIDLVNQARQITNIITGVLGVFGVTALIVSSIGAFNTMIVSFMERIYEVGVLKSIGATDSDVRNLFLMESAIMGFLGGLGGLIIGIGGGQLMNLLLNIIAGHLGGKPFTLFITPLWFIALSLALSVTIGLFSGFWPAHLASQLSPKEAFLRK